MISFKEYLIKEVELEEGVVDVQQVKRKRLVNRTPREQAAINATKQSKPSKGVVEIHLKHEDGSISKSKFKLMKREAKWDEESQEIANSHLNNMQAMHNRFPDLMKDQPKPVEVHKVIIK